MRGFSLVEVLIVVGLLGVLGAGVLSLIGQGPSQTARDGRRKADVESIRSALELYRHDQGGYPLGSGALVPGYISQWPTDPKTGGPYPYSGVGCGPTRCSGYSVCADLERINGLDGACDYQVTNP